MPTAVQPNVKSGFKRAEFLADSTNGPVVESVVVCL